MLRWIKDLLIDPEFNRKRKFLQRVPLFNAVSRREFGHLFQSLAQRHYQSGEILFQEGDVGRALFILESGHIEICRMGQDGQPKRLALLTPGDYFGEMSLLDDRPRTATAVAVNNVNAYLLYRTELEKLTHTAPHIAAAIMTHLAMLLAARLRSTPFSIASTIPTKEAI